MAYRKRNLLNDLRHAVASTSEADKALLLHATAEIKRLRVVIALCRRPLSDEDSEALASLSADERRHIQTMCHDHKRISVKQAIMVLKNVDSRQ